MEIDEHENKIDDMVFSDTESSEGTFDFKQTTPTQKAPISTI